MKQLSITNFFGNNEISISPQDASRTTTTISKQFEPSPTSEIIEPSTPHGFNYSKSPTPLEESVESATISLESENTISPESNTERPGNISVLDFDQRDGNEIELFLACSRQVFNERFNILGDDLYEINYDSEEDMDDYGEDLDDFSLFEERVVNVLKATTRCYISDQWHEFIEMMSSTQWAQIICDFTIPAVKKMLNNTTTEAPKLQDLANIPWFDTRESGVYGHLFTPLLDGHHNHFYIGEASGLKGLSGRQNEHKKEIGKGPKTNKINSFHYNIYQSSPRKSYWSVLFLIPDLDTKRNGQYDGIEWTIRFHSFPTTSNSSLSIFPLSIFRIIGPTFSTSLVLSFFDTRLVIMYLPLCLGILFLIFCFCFLQFFPSC